MRRLALASSLAILVLAMLPVLAGQAFAAAPAGSATPARAAAAPDPPVLVSQTFEPADSGASALTYNHRLVPVGARVTVASVSAQHATATLLAVNGLVPERHYGAHVHMNRCGRAPDDSGPHTQWRADPVQPSVNPKYANPHNEIWLDFTTDRDGNAVAASEVRWPVEKKMARSVVIHDHGTSSAPGHAGEAGARLACVDVDFSHAGGQVPGVTMR
jgi:Cu-Zn family superoxide dismutase